MTRAAVGILADSYNVSATPTPPDGITGLFAWFDASDPATITDAGAGNVSQWNDKSGNARHLTQATGANRPVTGSRTINSRNVLDFNTLQRVVSTGIILPQPFTIVMVAQSDKPDANARAGTGRGDGQVSVGQGSNQWRMTAGTPLLGGTDGTTPVCLVAGFNTTSSTLHSNGTLMNTGNAGSTAFTGQIYQVGGTGTGTASWDGTVAEVAVYNRLLTVAERQGLEAHLKTKWGIP